MKKSFHSLSAFFFAVLTYFFITFTIYEKTVLFFPKSVNILSQTFLFAGLVWIYKKVLPSASRSRSLFFLILAGIISAVFSLISVMGVFFQMKAPFGEMLRTSPSNVWKVFLAFCGGFIAFFTLIKAFGSLRKFRHENPAYSCALTAAGNYLYKKNTFLKSFVLLLICWTPQIIIRYPGALPTDSIVSLKQYFGVSASTTQHPILYTVLVGKFMDLGILIGNPGIGFFLLILVQVILMLLVLSYTMHNLKKMNVPSWFAVPVLAFFAVTPIFSATATTALIDAPYGAFFLLLMNELVSYLFCRSTFLRSPCHYLLTALAVFGMHTRHNGIYIVLAVIVLTGIMELYFLIKKQQKLVLALLLLAVMLVPAFGGKALSSALYSHYNAKAVSTRAMFALPIQQVSRCLATHGRETEQEDLHVIQKVLTWDVDEYPRIYNPLNFDGVKKGFNNNASGKDIAGFLKIWMKFLIKYPETCFSATANQTYFLFSPLASNHNYYAGTRSALNIKDYDFTTVNKKVPFLAKPDQQLLKNYQTFGQIPFLGLLVNQGFYSLLLLTVSLYALCERNGKLLFLAVPALLTLAVTFVGPAVWHHPRYTYPIMYAMPLLLGIFITTYNQSNER